MLGATFGLLICWVSVVVGALDHRCNESICTLMDVHEFDIRRLAIPKVPELVFESGRIPVFGRSLVSNLEGVIRLSADYLQIESLFVSPEWEQLSAVGNSIRALELDTTNATYRMLALQLADNKLSEVPTFGKFTRLRILNLDGNAIAKLSMAAFAELTELRVLSLARNGLQEIISPNAGFALPKLRSLSLADNELQQLNIANWELDSLETLHVRGNQLQELNGDLRHFGRLKVLQYGQNRWRCDWLQAEIQKFVRDRENIKVDADDEQYCGANGAHMLLVGRICCEGRLEHPVVSAGKFANRWMALKTVTQRYQLFRNEANFAIEPVKNGISGTRLELQELLRNSTNDLSEVTVQAKNAHSELVEQLEDLQSKRQVLEEAIDGIRSTMLTYFRGLSDRLDAFANDAGNDVTRDYSQLSTILQQRTVKLRNLINSFRGQVEKTVHQQKQLKEAKAQIDKLQRFSEQLTEGNQEMEWLLNNMWFQFQKDIDEITDVAYDGNK